MPLRSVPLGTEVHNLEMIPGRGAQVARGAGAVAIAVAREGDYTQVRLPRARSDVPQRVLLHHRTGR